MKQIFYSNGVDIFGPVSLNEFSRNRYYKSTLIWYEGLSGWVNIEECDDLKHLIGTMPALDTDHGIAHALPNLTPPITKKQTIKPKAGNRLTLVIAAILAIILLVLVTYYFNSRINPEDRNMSGTAETNEITQPKVDSNATREAERVKIAAMEAEKKTYRMNWEKFIVAVTNDYKQKEIGGIDDLKIIIKNTSPYKIDQVVVKVSYIKANGSNYQTETLTFDNIEANSNKELFAPESDRGVKVSCSILALKSTDMNICLDKREKGFSAKKGEDPYLCK